jgi:hypothetical protein
MWVRNREAARLRLGSATAQPHAWHVARQTPLSRMYAPRCRGRTTSLSSSDTCPSVRAGMAGTDFAAYQVTTGHTAGELWVPHERR